jgi:hypothetical protein
MSCVIGLFGPAFNKVGGQGQDQICLPRPLATAVTRAESKKIIPRHLVSGWDPEMFRTFSVTRTDKETTAFEHATDVVQFTVMKVYSLYN